MKLSTGALACKHSKRVTLGIDTSTEDVYASRMDGQNHDDKEYIKVVQEALTFSRKLKDNPHQYVIADNEGNENNIPVIDMSLEDEIVAQGMFDAATQWGFFQVTNHGVDQNLIDEMFDVTRRFMALDHSTKGQYQFQRSALCGYEKATQVQPSSGVPDYKENFLMAARKGAMDPLWPREVLPDFEPKSKRFMERCHEVGTRILRLLEGKSGMDQGQISDCNTLWGDEGKCVLRLLHYPPTNTLGNGVSSNQWRAAPHTDFSTLSLLFQKPGEGGLQCAQRHPSKDVTASEPLGWQPVPPVKGAITVNIGDMLQRWSSDKLISNLHRVVLPSSGDAAAQSRYSVAFFLQPDDSTVIESDKYQTVTAKEMVQGRVRAYWPKMEKKE